MFDFGFGFWSIVFIGALIIFFIWFIAASYIKAPPDKAYIISGLRKDKKGGLPYKVVIGRAALRIPFFERIDRLNLNLMQVDIKTQSPVPTAEYINIFIDGVANIKIGADLESISKAAENFLGRDPMHIAMVAQQVLEGNMREIVGQMQLSDLVQNRDKFAVMVQENALSDMKKMGLEIINLTIQNFVDKNGVIEDLGVDNISQIKKAAAIAKANADRDIKISQVRAMEEANKAQAEAETQIALQNKDMQVKKFEFTKEQESRKAEADSAYEIHLQEQRKTIESTSVMADIARREKEIELREKEIVLTEKGLDAEIKKKADADKYAIQTHAEAERFKRQQEADANKYIETQKAETEKILAEANRVKMEQEAKGIEAKGKAEAAAILAKAEAMKAMGEASILEMYLQVLPEMVKNVATPLSQTEKIVMYGEGNTTKLVEDVMRSSNQITDGLVEATGIDIKELLTNALKPKKDKTTKADEK